MSDTKEIQILLLEDDLQFADHLRSVLDNQPSHTFTCKRVATFEEAAKHLRLAKFDAMLVDFEIKGLNNMEQISDLIYHAPTLPILGLITATQNELANTAAEFGLQDTIVKYEHVETLLVSKVLFAIKRMQAMNKNNPLVHQATQFSILEELMYDSKTGLPNRGLFEDRLEQSLLRADRDGYSTVLLAIDLDQFSRIKDTFGDRTAEDLLSRTAKTLSGLTRDCDTISYTGQAKFMVALEKIEKPAEAIVIAERMLRAFSLGFHIGHNEIKMAISMGIAVYPDCSSMQELISSAELAMKRARDAGGNRYKLYTENLRKEGIWKYGLEDDLDKALESLQFEMHYQPLFDLRQEKVTGLEALLRWNHPEQGPLLPSAFIDHLESSDMILDVGEWVIREACQNLKMWHKQYPDFTMGINLSPKQLVDPYLLERVTTILTECDLSPKFIEFEIAKRQLIDTGDHVCQYNIQALHALEVSLALDEYGTEYDTEAYFRSFPKDTISTLKLDRTEIQGMMIDADAADRVRKYIDFSHQQNIRVVAEGVEDEQQVLTLIEYGADMIQGFLLSKAVASTELEDGLRRGEFKLFENLQTAEVNI